MAEDWIRVRRELNASRHELAGRAAALYPDLPQAAGTGLLTRPEWLPAEPVELGAITLRWVDVPPLPAVDGKGPETEHVRAGYGSYAEALGALARPRVFEDRPAYRLLDADLASPSPSLTFGPATYFDGVNVGEALAHELATGATTFRRAAGDPRDLAARPAIPAISTLTVRGDDDNDPAFVLHYRDAAKVAHGGGLHQVMPVGVFQPAGGEHDFDLWRGMVREYAEELLGQPEGADTSSLYEAMTEARDAKRIRVHCVGLGVDPLTWATDLLTVAVFDAATFDELFHDLAATNAEGSVQRVRFTRDALEPLLDGSKPIQAAGAAVLALAAVQWPGLA